MHRKTRKRSSVGVFVMKIVCRIVKRFPVEQPVSKIEVMIADMRNEEKQNYDIDRRFQPFHREVDIAIRKHPVSESFINRPYATTTNGTKKNIFSSLVTK